LIIDITNKLSFKNNIYLNKYILILIKKIKKK